MTARETAREQRTPKGGRILEGSKALKRRTPRTLESETRLRGFDRSKPLRGPEETLKAARTGRGNPGMKRRLSDPVSVEGEKA